MLYEAPVPGLKITRIVSLSRMFCAGLEGQSVLLAYFALTVCDTFVLVFSRFFVMYLINKDETEHTGQVKQYAWELIHLQQWIFAVFIKM